MKTSDNYSLVGVDGNAFAVIGYVTKAMRAEGFTKEEINKYQQDAMSSDYSHLISASANMVEQCNQKASI